MLIGNILGEGTVPFIELYMWYFSAQGHAGDRFQMHIHHCIPKIDLLFI